MYCQRFARAATGRRRILESEGACHRANEIGGHEPVSNNGAVVGRGEARIETGAVERVPDALLHPGIAFLPPGPVLQGETLGFAAHPDDEGQASPAAFFCSSTYLD